MGSGKSYSYIKEDLIPKIVSRADWSLQLDGFLVRFEIINDYIIHAFTSGFLKEEHLKPVFRLQEKVINSMTPLEGLYYFIGGLKGLK